MEMREGNGGDVNSNPFGVAGRGCRQDCLGTVLVETAENQATERGDGKDFSPRHIILRPQKSTSSPSFVCVKHSFLAVVSFMEIYL